MTEAVEDIVDRLYGLPLHEFTAARNDAARELRKAGRRDEAERVKALRKPTTAAAAVNRLVREHRDEVEKFLEAAAALRAAQFGGKGDLAVATREEHAALERLVDGGGEEVRRSLLAAAVDDDAAQHLREARLTRELEPQGFGSLLAHAPELDQLKQAATRGPERRASLSDEHPARTTTREAPKPVDGMARARLEDAEAVLKAAEEREHGLRQRLEEAAKDVVKAREGVQKARRELERARGGGQ